MGIARRMSMADFFTLANALLGFLAITYVTDGKYPLAGLLIFIAILLDGLDGALARRFGTKHQLGQYLDFFADSVSFCFAPATLVYAVTYDISRGSAWISWENALAVSIPTFYVCMGLIRLARFAEEGFRKPQFEGLPTPAAAYLVMTVYVLLRDEIALELGSQISVLAVMTVAGLLMLASLRYPKIQGVLVIPALAGILSMVTASLLSLPSPPYAESLTFFLTLFGLSLIAIYILLGPLYSKRKESLQVSQDMA
ncbi:MAG: CDP-diacylglycerol--serine O-phosphatidyltransferase [Thermoplasmata archaeon]